jgi:mono/diheme cytochrome c family protein
MTESMRRFLAIAAAIVLAAVVGVQTPAKSDQPAAAGQLARGRELAENVIHCSECHSPDKHSTTGRLAYSGGRVDDWYAPAINANADARVPWTEVELYSFLRTGQAPLHGVAAGSMQQVVHERLANLPDEDIHAIAAYFASVQGAPAEVPTEQVIAALKPKLVHSADERRGEWLFVGYCVSCHFNKAESETAKRPELALNTDVTQPDPTNLMRVILTGAREAGKDDYMPGFAMLLSDRDVASIAAYLRAAYAPDKETWTGLEQRAGEIRRLKDPLR